MTDRLNVLHPIKTSLPATVGGIEVFIDTLCNTTSALGIDTTILSLNPDPAPEPIQMAHYRVIQAKQDISIASTGFSLAAFAKYRQLAAEADIIHYHFPNPFADLLHLSGRTKKPTVITYHSDIIKQKNMLWLYRPLMEMFLGSVDRIVATSQNYLDSSDVLKRYADKIEVIPIGLDMADYPAPAPERLRHWRERLPERFFLFVGALRYYKGLHIALEALAGTDIPLVIAGIGKQERALKAQAKKLGLANVHFIGGIPDADKLALLQLCYGFAFPSHLRSEAFGVALLEAAAFGKPMVTCEIDTGTSFVNRDRETGLVIEPSDPAALQGAMRYLLDHPDRAREFGRNAQRRFDQLFTADKQAEAYARLYRSLACKDT